MTNKSNTRDKNYYIHKKVKEENPHNWQSNYDTIIWRQRNWIVSAQERHSNMENSSLSDKSN
jgi:RecB family endonuclease NucS